MSRLTIDMTDQQHQSLKALAALQGKSIKQYALERLLPASGEEQAWSELKNFLNKRIEQGLNGNVTPKSFDQIVDEELSTGEDSGKGSIS
ncbi:antitoxin [Asticcacaulis sp.]|uniref:antitoxin n=1 Tax=Asticcacaulis sp. TaxID=1872648 RepID=UPI002C044A86|nr:antitoxin [Asticcacaulis sp.]HTM82693.1 antitoxin [Asticcacaulis sp.]